MQDRALTAFKDKKSKHVSKVPQSLSSSKPARLESCAGISAASSIRSLIWKSFARVGSSTRRAATILRHFFSTEPGRVGIDPASSRSEDPWLQVGYISVGMQ